MTEESNYFFTLILKNAWGEVMTVEEEVSLREFKGRSPYHQELAERFGDIGWINGGLAQMEDFPKELIRQKIKDQLAQSAAPGKPDPERKDGFISVEPEETHIKVHKHWRWLFILVFIISKSLVIYAIWITIKYKELKQALDALIHH